MDNPTSLLFSSTLFAPLQSHHGSWASLATTPSNSGSLSMTPSTRPIMSTSALPSNSEPAGTSTNLDTSMAPSTRISTQSMSPRSQWSYTGSSLLQTAPTSSFSLSSSHSSTSPPQNMTTHSMAPSSLLVPTTVLTTFTLVKSTPASLSYPSTVTVTSVISGLGGMITYLPTSSGVLSTVGASDAVENVSPSPGTIAGLVLGVIGAIAFAVLWLFCARRRQHKLRDAALLDHPQYAAGPLEGEVLDDDNFAYGVTSVHDNESEGGPIMEERYNGILAALQTGRTMGAGVDQGSTTGVYGSRRDVLTDSDVDLAHASSPILPLSSLPSDEPSFAPLSPPPSHHQQPSQPAPPPSAYFYFGRRRSSPGLDASAWFGGYSVAPSCASHYAPSQTLGSGCGSGSVDALSRTQTGSEEPLLGIGKTSDLSHGSSGAGGYNSRAAVNGGNRLGLGSAFGSPTGSVHSPSASGPHHAFQGDTLGSSRYDMRSASGGRYTRSATPNSFDILRSVSSQGALSSVYSHGHGQNEGFRFGPGGPGSLSSGSTGKKMGMYRNSSGNPPTSLRAWKERGSGGSGKWKDGEGGKEKIKREKNWRQSLASSVSASGSAADEKQDRSSPGLGVRALLGRLRRAGHGTPSPRSSNRDLPSSGPNPTDVENMARVGGFDGTPPPSHQVATPQRAHYSFVLSNPDPHPPSPYSGNAVSSGTLPPHNARVHVVPDIFCPSPNRAGLHSQSVLPSGHMFGVPLPSPVPTEESCIAEGLLHPRLHVDGRSDSSLRDFEDYSRPIGGLVNNRMYSTTTFGTVEDDEMGQGLGNHLQDTQESLARNPHEQAVDVFGAAVGVQGESWFVHECTRAQDLGAI